ncbi:MAG: FadR/GntR family transcriptional regulator, partial [Mycobacterium sp.]
LSTVPVQSSNKAADEIVSALLHEMVTRRLPPGSRLPTEKDLARHFGISQPTVREAIRALDVMGLVDVRHGSGVYVRGDAISLVATALQVFTQMESVSIIDALDVRGLLGQYSAELAARSATEDDIRGIAAAYDQLDNVDGLKDHDQLIHAIADFQEALSRAGHNSLVGAIEGVLVRLLLQMQFKAMRRRGLKFWQRRAYEFQPDRLKLLDAIRARDARQAREAMTAYLGHQRQTFLKDPALAELRLDDPRALRAAADMSFLRVNKGGVGNGNGDPRY